MAFTTCEWCYECPRASRMERCQPCEREPRMRSVCCDARRVASQPLLPRAGARRPGRVRVGTLVAYLIVLPMCYLASLIDASSVADRPLAKAPKIDFGGGGNGQEPHSMTIQRIGKTPSGHRAPANQITLVQAEAGAPRVVDQSTAEIGDNFPTPRSFTNCTECRPENAVNRTSVETSLRPSTGLPRIAKQAKRCRLKAHTVRLVVPGCLPERVTINKCRGKCRSSLKPVAMDASEPATIDNMFRKRCRCCRATRTEVKEVIMHCGNDLDLVPHLIASALECDCSPCSGSD